MDSGAVWRVNAPLAAWVGLSPAFICVHCCQRGRVISMIASSPPHDADLDQAWTPLGNAPTPYDHNGGIPSKRPTRRSANCFAARNACGLPCRPCQPRPGLFSERALQIAGDTRERTLDRAASGGRRADLARRRRDALAPANTRPQYVRQVVLKIRNLRAGRGQSRSTQPRKRKGRFL